MKKKIAILAAALMVGSFTAAYAWKSRGDKVLTASGTLEARNTYASAEDDPVSLLWNLRDNWYAARETTRYKIAGGNDLLPKAFAEKLKEKIHYGSPVLRIEQDSKHVCAIALQSGMHR